MATVYLILSEHDFVSKNQCSTFIFILHINLTRFKQTQESKSSLKSLKTTEKYFKNFKNILRKKVMDGIETEITAAVNAFTGNEFQKMLEETEKVLDQNS